MFGARAVYVGVHHAMHVYKAAADVAVQSSCVSR